MSVDPRPAATVILLRDAEEGVEVWLMERSRSVGFMASAWVFPGGRVDPADAEAPLRGAPDPAIAPGFWAAAARELNEEAGVRLGDDGGWDVSGMKPWARWITPRIEPRRYDTWFFAARLPAGAAPVVDGQEAVAGGWFRPADALDRAGRGELPVAPPTMRTLAELSPYTTVAEVLAAPRCLVPIEPHYTRADDVVYVLLPGDPEHPSPDRVDPPHRYAFQAGRWWAR